MFTQMGDKKLKTILQTFQTFITAEIKFKESNSAFFSFVVEVLLIRANGTSDPIGLLDPKDFASASSPLCISHI